MQAELISPLVQAAEAGMRRDLLGIVAAYAALSAFSSAEGVFA